MDDSTPEFSFDLSLIAEQTGLDPADLLELLALFVTTATDNIGTLEAAIIAKDSAAAARAAHTIKGSSATLGLDRIADAASAIESAVRAGRFDATVTESLATLRAVLTVTHHTLRTRYPNQIA